MYAAGRPAQRLRPIRYPRRHHPAPARVSEQHTPKEIADATGIGYANVRKTCHRMAADGQLAADTAGRYRSAGTPGTDTPESVPAVPQHLLRDSRQGQVPPLSPRGFSGRRWPPLRTASRAARPCPAAPERARRVEEQVQRQALSLVDDSAEAADDLGRGCLGLYAASLVLFHHGIQISVGL